MVEKVTEYPETFKGYNPRDRKVELVSVVTYATPIFPSDKTNKSKTGRTRREMG